MPPPRCNQCGNDNAVAQYSRTTGRRRKRHVYVCKTVITCASARIHDKNTAGVYCVMQCTILLFFIGRVRELLEISERDLGGIVPICDFRNSALALLENGHADVIIKRTIEEKNILTERLNLGFLAQVKRRVH